MRTLAGSVPRGMPYRLSLLSALGLLLGLLPVSLPAQTTSSTRFTDEQLTDVSIDACLYAYPMVITEVTRRVGTNAVQVNGLRGPMGQLGSARQFPDATFTGIVRPNADTLYSAAFFDLSDDPMVIHVPDSQGRYYLMPILDMWTDIFACPGTRTTGNGEQTFAIVGPDWSGTLPDGIREIRSPTAIVFLIGRTQTNGKEDYAAVHAFQDGITAVPLSHYGKPYTPPPGRFDPQLDMSPPSLQVRNMAPAAFFTLFAELLKKNPPHANDHPMISQLQRLGIVPGQSLNFAALDARVQQALLNAWPVALAKIENAFRTSGYFSNGWRTNLTAIGTYGTDYLHRAGIAFAGLGANVVQDAVYPTCFTDSRGAPLESRCCYKLHFTREQLPPVNAFWSLTMYNEQQLFAENPINRYALGDRDQLKFAEDGSLTLYIQRESPGTAWESNWLPTPAAGTFTMNLRLYWPRPEVLDGRWHPPAVVLVK